MHLQFVIEQMKCHTFYNTTESYVFHARSILSVHIYGILVDSGSCMRLMRKHVIPRICAEWETVSAFLEYSVSVKNMIKMKHKFVFTIVQQPTYCI